MGRKTTDYFKWNKQFLAALSQDPFISAKEYAKGSYNEAFTLQEPQTYIRNFLKRKSKTNWLNHKKTAHMPPPFGGGSAVHSRRLCQYMQEEILCLKRYKEYFVHPCSRPLFQAFLSDNLTEITFLLTAGVLSKLCSRQT